MGGEKPLSTEPENWHIEREKTLKLIRNHEADTFHQAHQILRGRDRYHGSAFSEPMTDKKRRTRLPLFWLDQDKLGPD